MLKVQGLTFLVSRNKFRNKEFSNLNMIEQAALWREDYTIKN